MANMRFNIEKIHIKGDIGNLSTIITDMDRRMQELASNTERVKSLLVKLSAFEMGEQYAKATKSAEVLSVALFSASEDMNMAQNEIARYENKLYRYEDLNRNAQPVRKHAVQKVSVNVDQSQHRASHEEIILIHKELKGYCESTLATFKYLLQNKENIGTIWVDPQYNVFSAFIDGVVSETFRHVRTLAEYTNHLNVKIKELFN